MTLAERIAAAVAAALAAEGIGNEGGGQPPRTPDPKTAGTKPTTQQAAPAQPAVNVPDKTGVVLGGSEVEPTKNAATVLLEAKVNDLQAQLEASILRTEQTAKTALLEKNLARIDKLKREFKINPATGDKLAKLAESNPEAFAATADALDENGPILALTGQDAAPAAESSGITEFTKLETLTKKYMADNRTDYATAFQAVCSQHPDLAGAYRAAVGGN